MQENIITWNFPNWVTITLMALVGFLALGALMSVLKKRVGNSGGDTIAAGQTAQ